MKRTRWLACAAALLGGLLLAISGGSEAAAPYRRYTPIAQLPGWVLDTVTGLKWETVSSTQSYQPCCVTPTNWCNQRASGARVPTKKELESLVDFTTTSPAIDAATFGSNTANGTYATITPIPSTGSYWGVNFVDGATVTVGQTTLVYVRCVQ
jgi:Protein of unknown function (DUF1566)